MKVVVLKSEQIYELTENWGNVLKRLLIGVLVKIAIERRKNI